MIVSAPGTQFLALLLHLVWMKISEIYICSGSSGQAISIPLCHKG
jgi:hypothetical protein